MNPTAISTSSLRQVLGFVAETISREEANLNALDAAIGDGDHGITMRVGFSAISSKINSLPDGAGIDVILRESGMSFMGATGGASGVLFGKMLMAAGTALKGHLEIGPEEFKTLLASMETALASAGKAQPGDKTILDAVHAANQAVKARESTPVDLPDLLSCASQAAHQAAETTAQMLARAGRASRLGDRVLGHRDPGAVSFSVILEAMTAWAQKHLQPGG